jgi:hypothetical protein
VSSSVNITALVLAVLSLAASGITFALQRADRRGELTNEGARASQAIVTDLYQSWLTGDEQDCRRALYEARDSGVDFPNLDRSTQQKINHAIGIMNMIGFVHSAGRIPGAESIELFGGTAVRLHDAAVEIGYFAWREKLTGTTSWRHFREYAAEARRHESP